MARKAANARSLLSDAAFLSAYADLMSSLQDEICETDWADTRRREELYYEIRGMSKMVNALSGFMQQNDIDIERRKESTGG